MEETRQREVLEDKRRKEMILEHSATVQSHVSLWLSVLGKGGGGGVVGGGLVTPLTYCVFLFTCNKEISTPVVLYLTLSWSQTPLFTALDVSYHQHTNKVGLMTCLCIPCPSTGLSTVTKIQNNFILRF